ncbi:MAG: hypothetical protein JXD22_02665, partial [Sedimentisphaerales bacterium]|nr:hypothetical protein [Sedimentisphaerales bacterium]
IRRAGPVLAGVGSRAGNVRDRAKKQIAETTRAITAVMPTSQREAAIREVTALQEETLEDEDEQFDEDDLVDEESAQEQPAKSESRDKDSVSAQKNEQIFGGSNKKDLKSIEALSEVLERMRSKMPVTATPPAGVDLGGFKDYKFPTLDLLSEPVRGFTSLQEKIVIEKSRVLEQTLSDFNINAEVVDAETGPVITMFELKLAPGVKVSQISNLANDLARSLGAAAVRVVAPLPGKHTIGIEVPNVEKEKVRIKELLQLSGSKPSKMQIPLFLGKDASGEALVVDLTVLPHALIAGTTGSGKSICINSIIMSIILTQRPDLVKLILVDPKMVEMNIFRDLPHLMCPIVTEMKRAEHILEWLTVKMDERYALLAEARVRNIDGFNRLTKDQIYERFCPSSEDEKTKIPLRLPYIVIIIDELADLMMTSAKEVEGHIIRLAQKSRAVGIHIVLATQRPQATVVTGLIKSNLPSRISFRVAARMDSRIVLDQNGAETLLGRGDMLFLQPGTSELVRAQGTFLSDDEIHRVMKFVKEVALPHYHPELMQLDRIDPDNLEKDELFDEAVKIILQTKRGSVSLLQRRLNVGYSRASRLIDQMAIAGIVGEYKGSQAREVLISAKDYERIKQQMERDAAAGFTDLQQDTGEQDYSGAPGAADASDLEPAESVSEIALQDEDQSPQAPLDEIADDQAEVVEDLDETADQEDSPEVETDTIDDVDEVDEESDKVEETEEEGEDEEEDEGEEEDVVDEQGDDDDDEYEYEYEYEYVDAEEGEDGEDGEDGEEEGEEEDDEEDEDEVKFSG